MYTFLRVIITDDRQRKNRRLCTTQYIRPQPTPPFFSDIKYTKTKKDARNSDEQKINVLDGPGRKNA